MKRHTDGRKREIVGDRGEDRDEIDSREEKWKRDYNIADVEL